jgi:hypothetical protein
MNDFWILTIVMIISFILGGVFMGFMYSCFANVNEEVVDRFLREQFGDSVVRDIWIDSICIEGPPRQQRFYNFIQKIEKKIKLIESYRISNNFLWENLQKMEAPLRSIAVEMGRLQAAKISEEIDNQSKAE